jgi:pimeloyl-ACP methyl ester carboxylesterase
MATLDVFARDLEALLDARGVTGSIVLCGLSMGGQIVMEFCRLFPDRVAAIALAATVPQNETVEGRLERHAMADRLLREGMAAYAEEILPKMLADRSIRQRPAVAEHVLGMMRRAHPPGAAAALRGRAEQAYRMHGEKRYYMDPKGHIVLDKYPGEWEAMPSYIEEPEAAACKWVSIRERNREKYDLPTVFSILIYTHPETGFRLAICDGSYHTVMRTGAAGAVSAKWMARKNSKRLAIVGAGRMARARWRPATRSSSGRRCEYGAAPRRRSITSWRRSNRTSRT